MIRSDFRRWSAASAVVILLASGLVPSAGAAPPQHGQFDQTPVNPRDEAYIFTPSGFEREGVPALASGSAAAKLSVTVVDSATGKPTFCRVNVVGADGNFYQPKDNPLLPFSLTGKWPDTLAGNRPGKAPIRYFGHFFYTSGQFSVDVPEGTTRVEVWKGFEYRPESYTVKMQRGGPRDIKLSISRVVPMAELGWHSGDPHLHFIRASDANDATIFDLLEAEDIRFGPILCYNEPTNVYPGVMPEMATPQLRGLGTKSIRRRGDYQIISGQEYRNGVFGHLNLFGRDSLVLDGTRLDPNVGPMFGTIGAETQKQGGYAFHAHGGYGLEIWADLMQGATNGVELLQFGIYRGIGLDGWYHILNAGFRFPGIAACDYPACRKLGDCRTYVHIARDRAAGEVPAEPLSFQDCFKGAAEGRSFMSTAPLILLTVDGQLPGDIITTHDSTPRTVAASVQVYSPTAPVSDVQLIINGKVADELHVNSQAGQSQTLDLVGSFELKESSWIAARAFSKSPTGSADAEAHTNPVYVHLNGKAPYREADLDWLVARIDEQIADHQARTAPEKAVAVDYFRRSRDLLLEMRRRGGQQVPAAKKSAVLTPRDSDERAAPAQSAVLPSPQRGRGAGGEGADVKASAGATRRSSSSPRPSPIKGEGEGLERPAKTEVGGSSPVPGDPPGESLAEFLKSVPARSPAEAVKSFEVLNGFRMELVAHEPDVTDPVAACFDENGGMYVAEMIDYPYRPQEGQTPLGRLRYLVDGDGDGTYEQSWIFADKIVWPTGVVCYQGGVYVAAAPDIWYLKDTNGDHVADVREKIYTGFGDRNQQGGVNNLNWCIDHTIYGSGSTNGGFVRPADNPTALPIVLSGRDFHFDPATHKFETVSGSKQFGNAFDDWFNRFLCSESKPAYHAVLPQHYLARNPYLAVPTALNDLAHGVTPIFRISPIERWREIRSSRRLAAGERSADSAGLSHNVIDAAAGLTIYRGHAYPKEYLGNLFVGCSQNNLIHRRKLIADGATFRSERADPKTEFVRTSDTWFRPVNCINAPDGTLWVLDMSREVIESVHIANDVVAHLDLTNGRDKGRIYRLAPPGFKVPPQPRLGQATTAELVGYLEHPSGWWRDTASRLILERQDRSAVELLRRRLVESTSPVGRLHILWALDALASLEESDLLAALHDSAAGVREHAVRLAEPRLSQSSAVLTKVLELAADNEPRVRFQVAFTLGQTTDDRAIDALAGIALRDAAEPWIRTAVLSSSAAWADRLLAALTANKAFLSQPESSTWLEQLTTIVGSRKDDAELHRSLDAATAAPPDSRARLAVVLGLGAGLQRSGSSLETIKTVASPAAASMLDRLVKQAVGTAQDAAATVGNREDALRLLGYAGGSAATQALVALLAPGETEALQISAVRTLARFAEPQIAEHLIRPWRRSTPKVQEEIIVALASRQTWVARLLDACDREEVISGQITRTTRTALLNHRDPKIRSRAEKLLGGDSSARHEVVAQYRSALELKGDAARGDKIYERECTGCHRLAERGFAVGPNLALTRNRTPAALLEAILDPNREVQPSFVNYVVIDDSGRTLTGLILAETAGSITLGREKEVSESILKKNIDQLHSTGKSLMPEGLEKTIDPQGMADLLAFLRQVQYDIGTLPDFVQPND